MCFQATVNIIMCPSTEPARAGYLARSDRRWTAGGGHSRQVCLPNCCQLAGMALGPRTGPSCGAPLRPAMQPQQYHSLLQLHRPGVDAICKMRLYALSNANLKGCVYACVLVPAAQHRQSSAQLTPTDNSAMLTAAHINTKLTVLSLGTPAARLARLGQTSAFMKIKQK